MCVLFFFPLRISYSLFIWLTLITIVSADIRFNYRFLSKSIYSTLFIFSVGSVYEYILPFLQGDLGWAWWNLSAYMTFAILFVWQWFLKPGALQRRWPDDGQLERYGDRRDADGA